MKIATPAPENMDFHGLPAVRIVSRDGAAAVITRHGGQLVSWIPAGGRERLFLSERSRFAAGQAIRGGVPVIFPQFADAGPLPRHGFARTAEWTLLDARAGESYACATLRLTDSAVTRALWPHAFVAELTVMIEGKRLDIEFEVENSGTEGFSFTAALHSYFNVARADMCRVQGLEGLNYIDRVDGGKRKREDAEALHFEDEIDRVYLRADKPLLLWEPARSLAIEAEGFPDVVLWNPWEKKGAALPDMTPRGFRDMLCIEAAAVAQPLVLAAGQRWFGRQTAIAL